MRQRPYPRPMPDVVELGLALAGLWLGMSLIADWGRDRYGGDD